jgi:hypothetical protein
MGTPRATAEAPKGLAPRFVKQIIDFPQILSDTLGEANIVGRRACPYESILKAV